MPVTSALLVTIGLLPRSSPAQVVSSQGGPASLPGRRPASGRAGWWAPSRSPAAARCCRPPAPGCRPGAAGRVGHEAHGPRRHGQQRLGDLLHRHRLAPAHVVDLARLAGLDHEQPVGPHDVADVGDVAARGQVADGHLVAAVALVAGDAGGQRRGDEAVALPGAEVVEGPDPDDREPVPEPGLLGEGVGRHLGGGVGGHRPQRAGPRRAAARRSVTRPYTSALVTASTRSAPAWRLASSTLSVPRALARNVSLGADPAAADVGGAGQVVDGLGLGRDDGVGQRVGVGDVDAVDACARARRRRHPVARGAGRGGHRRSPQLR